MPQFDPLSPRYVPMPPRVGLLNRDEQGFPIPWHDTLTMSDAMKAEYAHRTKRCWICGEHMGAYLCFSVATASTLTRTTRVPASHLACAGYAAAAAPLLLDQSFGRDPFFEPRPSHAQRTHPGVHALWTTKSYTLVRLDGRLLFDLGPPVALAWFHDDRAATLEEVSESMAAAMPNLIYGAETEGPEAELDLLHAVQDMLPMMPRAAHPTAPVLSDV